MYVYIHTYYVYLFIYLFIYSGLYIYTCMYIYIHITHIYIFIFMCRDTLMYIHICIYIHVQIIYIWSRPPSLHPPAPPSNGLAAFLRSSFVFAKSLQHFWLPVSHLLGTCYLLGDLRSTQTPSKYLRAAYVRPIVIYTCAIYLLPIYYLCTLTTLHVFYIYRYGCIYVLFSIFIVQGKKV